MRKHILDRMTEADRATAIALTDCLKMAKAELKYSKDNYYQTNSEVWSIVIKVIGDRYTDLIKKYLTK